MKEISKEHRAHLELTSASSGAGSHFGSALSKLLKGDGRLSDGDSAAIEAALKEKGPLYALRNEALRSLLEIPEPEPEVIAPSKTIASLESRIAQLEAQLKKSNEV